MALSERRLSLAALLLLLPAAMAVYGAARSGGAVAAACALLAVALAAALVVRAGVASDTADRERIRARADAALGFAPGALVAYLGFAAGGYYPDATGYAAVALAVLVAARAALSERPFAGVGRPAAIAGAALGAFAGWTLLSGAWSDAEGRALVEFERALLYFLAFVLMAMTPRTEAGMRRLVWGLALGVAAVCLGGLATRLLPEVFPTASAVRSERLSYPVGYWNGLGLLAAIGIVLCGHLASDDRERGIVRVAGAAVIPALAVTLYLTLSRGAIMACVLGLVLYFVVARPAGFLPALIAAGPASLAAVLVAYSAEALTSGSSVGDLAVSQGRDVAVTLAVLSAFAGGLRGVLLPLDDRLARLRPVPEVQLMAAAVATLAIAVAWAGLDGNAFIHRQYDRLVDAPEAQRSPDPRQRLKATTGGGRADYWRSALRAFDRAPVGGQGAGTFETWWARDRPVDLNVNDAHSLYLEVLGELGVVGLLLLVVTLATIVACLAVRARGPTRAIDAALLAAIVVWAAHAGLDWDWELPAVTAWVFAAAGTALARKGTGAGDRPPTSLLPRAAAVLAALLLALPPLALALSQRHLELAVAAYDRGDCAQAGREARAARTNVGSRAEPLEILGLCDARSGRARAGLTRMRAAIARDPDDWEYRYQLAVVRAAAGLDPGPALRAARRLNPREPVVGDLARALRARGARERALRARRVLRDPLFVR